MIIYLSKVIAAASSSMATTGYSPSIGSPLYLRTDGQIVDSSNTLLGISVTPSPPLRTAVLHYEAGRVYALLPDGSRIQLATTTLTNS